MLYLHKVHDSAVNIRALLFTPVVHNLHFTNATGLERPGGLRSARAEQRLDRRGKYGQDGCRPIRGHRHNNIVVRREQCSITV